MNITIERGVLLRALTHVTIAEDPADASQLHVLMPMRV